MPEMIYVDSSNVEAIGYDGDARELHVQFVSGRSYVYYEVPQDVFDAFMSATSKGSFPEQRNQGRIPLYEAVMQSARDFRFACPRWTPYTSESRSAHENLLHRTIVQVLRPSLSPR